MFQAECHTHIQSFRVKPLVGFCTGTGFARTTTHSKVRIQITTLAMVHQGSFQIPYEEKTLSALTCKETKHSLVNYQDFIMSLMVSVDFLKSCRSLTQVFYKQFRSLLIFIFYIYILFLIHLVTEESLETRDSRSVVKLKSRDKRKKQWQAVCCYF